MRIRTLLFCALAMGIKSGALFAEEPTSAPVTRNWDFLGPLENLIPDHRHLLQPFRDIHPMLVSLHEHSIIDPGRETCAAYTRRQNDKSSVVLQSCVTADEKKKQTRVLLDGIASSLTVLTTTPAAGGVKNRFDVPSVLRPESFDDADLRDFAADVSPVALQIQIDAEEQKQAGKITFGKVFEINYRQDTSDADTGVREFSYQEPGKEAVVFRWLVVNSGESGTQQLQTLRDGTWQNVGKFGFYGLVNRWFIRPICEAGESFRKQVASAVAWPEVTEIYARDCADEGIRADGKIVQPPE